MDAEFGRDHQVAIYREAFGDLAERLKRVIPRRVRAVMGEEFYRKCGLGNSVGNGVSQKEKGGN